MTTHTPDNWIVVSVKGDDPHYRVLGVWSGSYLYGSSWRLNSGIVSVTETEDHFIFAGSSGSDYVCHKERYGLKMNNAQAWSQLRDIHGDNVEMVDSDTNWHEVDWIIEMKTDSISHERKMQ